MDSNTYTPSYKIILSPYRSSDSLVWANTYRNPDLQRHQGLTALGHARPGNRPTQPWHAAAASARALSVSKGLFHHSLREVNRLLPHRNKSLRDPTGQYRQSRFAIQTLSQARPLLIEQAADPRRTATPQLQVYAFHRRPLTRCQHRVRGGKHVAFRYSYRHGAPPSILGLIMECYPSLFFGYCKYDTFNVLSRTVQASLR